MFNEISKEANLWDAWLKVRHKNARGGIDGIDPEDLDARIRTMIRDLSKNLQDGYYVPTPLQRVTVPKFNEANERRTLSLPVVTDKIVQQAAVSHLAPVFEKDFLDCSYAYRPAKGPGRAIKRVEHIMDRKLRWAACCDIDNCFDSLNHDRMRTFLAEKISDDRFLNLIDQWMKSGAITQKGDYVDPTEGIAQGSVISPLLSNIYLHHLDLFSIGQKFRYVRYADNFVCFFYQKAEAVAGREALAGFLDQELFLKLNAEKHPVQHVMEGFSFLGVFFKGNERAICREKMQKATRKLTWLTETRQNVSPETLIKRLNEHVVSQKRFYEIIRPERQFLELDEFLFNRLDILMTHYAGQQILTTRNRFHEVFFQIQFYSHTPESAETRLQKLIDAVLKKQKAPEKKETGAAEAKTTSPGDQKKRQRAVTSRMMKQVGEYTEVLIHTPGVFIGKTANRLVLRENRKKVHEQPFSKIRQITITTKGVAMSGEAVTACAKHRIPLTFVGRDGRPLAVLGAPDVADADMTLVQARMVDTDRAFYLIRRILTGKCRNQMNVLKFYTRHRGRTDPGFSGRVRQNLEMMEKAVSELQEMTGDFAAAKNRVFTAEARVGGYYWDIIKLLLPPELGFDRREKHGATDVVNSMLNYGYGILYQRLWQAITAEGLNPGISFLHSFQKGKPTLVYDLVEEFRQPFVDRPIFSMLTKGIRYQKLQVNPDGMMETGTKNAVMQAILNKLSSLSVFRGKKLRSEEILSIQVKNVADYISGKSDRYLPYIASY